MEYETSRQNRRHPNRIGDIPMEYFALWSKRLGSSVKMTQCLTRIVLIQVKEICLFRLLGTESPKFQLSPENPKSRT
jgi:hypothetical protein